jgi:carboxyl-terminal processing protease
MVIDLRGNPGGIGILAMGLAGYFLDKQNLKLGTLYMRDLPMKFVVNPRAPEFHGAVAILIDGLSASTSEIFAGGLQDLKRARVFGTRSAGAALPSMFERLPNGDGFQYAMATYRSESGKTLEGSGVTPDVSVPLTRAALLAGHDAALEAAMQWIHSQSSKGITTQ